MKEDDCVVSCRVVSYSTRRTEQGYIIVSMYRSSSIRSVLCDCIIKMKPKKRKNEKTKMCLLKLLLCNYCVMCAMNAMNASSLILMTECVVLLCIVQCVN